LWTTLVMIELREAHTLRGLENDRTSPPINSTEGKNTTDNLLKDTFQPACLPACHRPFSIRP